MVGNTIRRCIEQWFAYSERRMVDAIKRMPPGKLSNTTVYDPLPPILPDGLPLRVDVAVDAEKENSVYIPEELLRAQGSSQARILAPELMHSNRAALAQHGLSMAALQNWIGHAIGGAPVIEAFEDRLRVPVVLRSTPSTS